MVKGNVAPRTYGTSLLLREGSPSSSTMGTYGAPGINPTPTMVTFDDLRLHDTLHSYRRPGALHSSRSIYNTGPP